MRLKEIGSIEEANKFLQEYLPQYDRRFTVKSKKSGNLHRNVPKGIQLNGILCIKAERVLRNDFTISYYGKLYQENNKPSIKTKKYIPPPDHLWRNYKSAIKNKELRVQT